MGHLSLNRERGRVRVFQRQFARAAEPLTLILSPSSRGEAKKLASRLAHVVRVARRIERDSVL
jgi:hypothetical protein